jgi:hypothetical protein
MHLGEPLEPPPVCADVKNPALSVHRKRLGNSSLGAHPTRPAPAVAHHDPLRSADARRSAIGRPVLGPIVIPEWGGIVLLAAEVVLITVRQLVEGTP